MMKRDYLYMCLLLLCSLLFCTGCTENEMWADEETVSEGLVLNLLASGEAVVAGRSIASDEDLREDVVENVDVFFFAADNKEEVARYYHKEVGEDGKVLLETGNWKSKFPEASYDVYVVANFHQYDDASTPDTETDLSRIKTWTALVALSDTDPDIFKVENDRFGNEDIYTGKKFMMDGKKEGWTPGEGTDETIVIDLARAAAKIVVNVSYTDDFLVADRTIVDVRKKLVRYAQDVRVLAEADPIPILDLYGDADGAGMSTSNYTEGSGVARKDVLYAYSYPNEWGDNVADQETYILMNIPYTDGSQEDLYQNYYKIPVRISNTAADLCLKRNTVYTINVTVDRVGNKEIDQPVELKPEISIASWQNKEIEVGGDAYKYLIVSEDEIEMHNVADTVVTFFSSSAIKVTLDAAYYVDKSGNEISLKETSSDWYSVDYDESALSGELKIHSEVPKIVTARYFTLTVTNGDGMEKTIHVIQYPLEYISGVPGLYSYVEQYINEEGKTVKVNGGWPSNFSWDGEYFTDIKKGLNGHIGNNPYMKSKFYRVEEKKIYRIDESYSNHVRENTNAHNNRMYLVQISSTSEKYTVARPKMTGTGVGSVTALGEENNRLVSPAFMLASNLGNIGDVNWVKAQDNCKYYVEHSIYTVEKADRLEGKNYDGKGHRCFDDWRLPTYAELQIIAGYQSTQTVVMDSVLTDDYYWAADKYTYLITAAPKPTDNQIPTGTDSKSDGKVRCIRDVTPEDLKELRAHNIR
ncbi:fimbrial tip adhesin FimD [Bacteroides mediterraneensis]|uniref:fimbrial tip adhesin FimD n=1 Tax=Bacteroides mediterraneensis TaxID=1841856 RepID=UPI000A767594|nr:fimbrial protein [Bacteroides mediterraneensis]